MKIAWPYDPFLRNRKLDLIGKNIISNYFNKDSIEAIYVASNSEVELTNAYNIPLKYRYSLYPKKIIKSQLKDLECKNFKVEVLTLLSLSLTKLINALIKHAIDTKINLIIMATNSRKPFPAFVFGSFAETLLHLSPIDLLIYHQKTRLSSKSPKKILYAHDYTSKGSLGLLKLIPYAKKWDATVYVVHVPTPEADQSDEEYAQSVERKTKKCRLLLESNHIKHEMINVFDDAKKDQIILKVAKKQKIDLIALTAQSNKLQILLGGSITRKVLLKAETPVLVLKA